MYLKIENVSNFKRNRLFVRCKNKNCQKNIDEGYIDVSSYFDITEKFTPTEIILPCCKSKALVKDRRFLPINRKTPKKMRRLDDIPNRKVE